ncbi:MAG: YggS family pyridoxal phosphate-dependent enzyme [Gemmatimonadaceae bacterium]|nr:YggS family pyridoxal phosphate-dependent enzyme [Gemmatimonadaceae bacterium]
MNPIARNWEEVRRRVAEAAERSGRRPHEVELVVVTKGRTPEEVAAALEAGVTDVGENRVQEAGPKKEAVETPARWHLVGGLQRNKAGRAVEIFDMVQSVDSLRLAEALSRRAATAGLTIEMLLQVNTAGAEYQGGVDPGDLPALAETAATLEGLRVRGLMTIAAHSAEEERVRACFRCLRDLGRRLPSSMTTLSMGMSGDYEMAIEEGATMIRVGTAVFGPRRAAPAAPVREG